MANMKLVSLLDHEVRTAREAVERDLTIAVAIVHRDIMQIISRLDKLRYDVDQLMDMDAPP
jgi:uncharacterized protein HemX